MQKLSPVSIKHHINRKNFDENLKRDMTIHKQLNGNFVWSLMAAAMSMPPLEF